MRPLLHAEIDKLKDQDLAAAHRALLEIEMQRLLNEMDEATDRAWESGEITTEKIAEAIAAHRAARDPDADEETFRSADGRRVC